MTKEEEINFAIKGKQNARDFYLNRTYSSLFNQIARISPIIIFPLLSLYLNNWWLLLGILITYIGGILFNKPIFAIIILAITIFYSLKYGFAIRNQTIIFFLSYLYGHITVSISKYFLNRWNKTKMQMTDSVDKEMSKLFKQPQQSDN